MSSNPTFVAPPAAPPDTFRILFENSTDGLLLLERGRFVDCNRAALRMLGCQSKAQVIGLTPAELSPEIQPDGRLSIEKQRELALTMPLTGSAQVEWLHRRPDGALFPVEVTLTAIQEGSRELVLAVWRDITARKQMEAALQNQLELDALITRISTNFINLPLSQVDQGIRDALRAIGEFVGADRSYLITYSDDRLRMNALYEWCADGIPTVAPRGANLPIENIPWFNLRIMQREIVLYLPPAFDLPPEADIERARFEAQGVQSRVALPMESGGEVVGFVGFDAVRQPIAWSKGMVDLLKIAGSIFANVLERKRAQMIQNGQRRFLELLAADSSLESTLTALIRITQEQAAGMMGAVWLLDGGAVRLGAAVGVAEDYLHRVEGARIGPMCGSSGTAMHNRQPVIADDIAINPHWVGELCRVALENGLRAAWAQPVFASNGDVLGAFTMYYSYPHIPTAYHLRQLKTAAHLAGVAIEHKWSQEALQQANIALERRVEERTRDLNRRRHVAESLRKTLGVLNASPPPDTVLSHIVTEARQISGADSTVLYRADFKARLVQIEAVCDPSNKLTNLNHFPLDSVLGRMYMAMFQTHEIAYGNHPYTPQMESDILNTPDPEVRRKHLVLLRDFAASLALPLLIKGEMYGVLAFTYREPQLFSEEEIGVAVAFTEQAALAIENSRLHEQLQRSAAEAERGRLARDLHDSVTQTLFSASLIAEVLPRVWDSNPGEARGLLQEVRLLTRGALAEMRTLLLELRPAALMQAELAESLRHLVDAAAARAGIPVELVVKGREPLTPEVKVALYRIAQEALNNVARHAAAQRAAVVLDSRADAAAITVTDDGRGFDCGSVPPSHFGLSFMAERAAAIRARLSVESQPGRGTCVSVLWPRETA